MMKLLNIRLSLTLCQQDPGFQEPTGRQTLYCTVHPILGITGARPAHNLTRGVTLPKNGGVNSLLVQTTVDPQLTDSSTYRLFKLQTSLAAKFRFDLQPENRLTHQEKNQNETKTEQKRPVTD